MDNLKRRLYIAERFNTRVESGGKIIIEDKEYNKQLIYNPKKDIPIFDDKMIVIFNISTDTFIVDVDRDHGDIVGYFHEETPSEHLKDMEMVENIKNVISGVYSKKEEKTLKKTAKAKKVEVEKIEEKTKGRIGELYTEKRTGTIRNNLLEYYRLKEMTKLPKKPKKYLKKLRRDLRKTDNLPAL